MMRALMAIPELSRRVFLRRSLHMAGALALVPGLSIGCAPGDVARAPTDLRALDPGEWELLGIVADTLIPRGGAFELGARDVDLATRIDAFLAEESVAVLRGLSTALLLIEWGSPLASGRIARFSRLGQGERAACIDALCRSRVGLLREVYAGVKQLCFFTFYAVDASWSAVGYDGPWIGRQGARG
jgi:hypothetical protein